ncbi:restriction endonuclease subunit S [Paenibacillus filicis]|uniref:Restriction endonuclease subunit S n=1 Tax=Paenibacillus gyeongsangnamensis TaxID=3388067 RepID=A0ABT4Q3Q6_9BACL|nr:restriction endonuclease subunit S [Paenibacillus filicis]MCZ8511469.1 restriction endonuclease subunit S [Paenibacillus filicis]
MRVRRIGDLFTIAKGKKYEETQANDANEMVRYIQIEDLRNDNNIKMVNKIDNGVYVTSNDVLIAWDGANAGTIGYNLTGIIGSTLAVLRPRDSNNYIPYIAKFLRSKSLFLRENCTGATIPHIQKKVLEDIEVPLPSFEQQKEIAYILDKAQTLIDKRQDAISKIDELILAVFWDMFGDPIKNDYSFCKKKLPDFVSKDKYAIKRGPFGGALKKDMFVKNGYLVYEQYHAINDEFTMARYFIDGDKFEELKAFEVFPGDLIVSCSGVTLGRIAEVPRDAKKGIINQALLKITLDQNIMNNTFFKYLFRHEGIQNILFGVSRGSGIPNFPPMEQVKDIDFITPPIELQRKFAIIVSKIEVQKKSYYQSLQHLESNFQALLQKAFKGELKVKDGVVTDERFAVI